MKKTERTLTTTEVATKLKVTRAAVTQWCRRGLFPTANVEETARGPVWRIPLAAMKAFTAPTPGRPRGRKKKQVSKRAKKKPDHISKH
jgi:hypothetical protein